jgi:hypothetical protein
VGIAMMAVPITAAPAAGMRMPAVFGMVLRV